MTKPIVVRIKGTNSDLAEKMVKESGKQLYWETTLTTAVDKVVELTD